MVAKLKKVGTTAANESLVSETFSREATMIAEHADGACCNSTIFPAAD
jgi:hypothetical protein